MSLHWVLDMQLREDESRARADHSAENLNVLRHWAFNLLKSDTSLKGRTRSTPLAALRILFCIPQNRAPHPGTTSVGYPLTPEYSPLPALLSSLRFRFVYPLRLLLLSNYWMQNVVTGPLKTVFTGFWICNSSTLDCSGNYTLSALCTVFE